MLQLSLLCKTNSGEHLHPILALYMLLLFLKHQLRLNNIAEAMQNHHTP